MIRLAPTLVLALTACAHQANSPAPIAAHQEEIRPAVLADNIQGRWTTTAINGEPVNGPWLLLGGEGPATIDQTDKGVVIGAPQPPTQAFLGCNILHLNGWTRNGDKLNLGIDYSVKTERGCDAAIMTREDVLFAILRLTMTMELNPPDRLRLVNEKGTVDLVRGER